MPKVVPEYKKEARSRIIETALKVFSDNGYHQTTMDDIARRLGVSKGALYLYFKSKEELFKGCYETAPLAFGEMLRSSFRENANPLEMAGDFFDRMQKQFASNSGLSYEIFAEASRNPPLKRILKENYDEYARILIRFLEELQDKGAIPRTLETRPLAKALIALWNGMETILTVGYSPSEVRRAWLEALKAMFLQVSQESHKTLEGPRASIPELLPRDRKQLD